MSDAATKTDDVFVSPAINFFTVDLANRILQETVTRAEAINVAGPAGGVKKFFEGQHVMSVCLKEVLAGIANEFGLLPKEPTNEPAKEGDGGNPGVSGNDNQPGPDGPEAGNGAGAA